MVSIESGVWGEFIQELETGRLFEVAADHVERIDSHISAVFLTGERAYKLKCSVRFDFLDFSTLDKRRVARGPELQINRRSAPALYRSLRAVTWEVSGALGLDGDGPVLDWLVEMERFDQGSLCDRMERRGGHELTAR